eukprot:COSAG01_NODE_42407_length_440_cov_1.000000_1_plen_100_part_01
MAATTVVQLYFQQTKGGAAVIRYYSQLVRFVRTHVPAGPATVTAHISLKISDLAYYDNNVRPPQPACLSAPTQLPVLTPHAGQLGALGCVRGAQEEGFLG